MVGVILCARLSFLLLRMICVMRWKTESREHAVHQVSANVVWETSYRPDRQLLHVISGAEGIPDIVVSLWKPFRIDCLMAFFM